MQRMARVIGRMGSWHNPLAVSLRSTILRLAWEGPVFKRLHQEMSSGARWQADGVGANA
jgi:hypothetical protein